MDTPQTICTSSPNQTKALAAKLVQDLSQSSVFALYGDLGSGKTTFIQGLGEFFQIDNHITSPSYTLIKQYPITFKNYQELIHVDLSRLNLQSGSQQLGLEDFIQDPTCIVAIEWPEIIASQLPAHHQLKFTSLSETKRAIEYQLIKSL